MWILGYFQSFAGNIVNRCFEKYRGEEQSNPTGAEVFMHDFENVLRRIGIEPPHCIRNFCCANFVVHKSRILAMSRVHWCDHFEIKGVTFPVLVDFSLPFPGSTFLNSLFTLEMAPDGATTAITWNTFGT